MARAESAADHVDAVFLAVVRRRPFLDAFRPSAICLMRHEGAAIGAAPGPIIAFR